uniref:Uncharacterized protein n=1 Tax=Rhizophora mucronata TaxID=61149 RepID=A0A2P2QMB5_RHIMU
MVYILVSLPIIILRNPVFMHQNCLTLARYLSLQETLNSLITINTDHQTQKNQHMLLGYRKSSFSSFPLMGEKKRQIDAAPLSSLSCSLFFSHFQFRLLER